MPSRRERAWLPGQNPGQERSPRHLPVDLLHRYGGPPAARIVVTRSRRGSVRSCSPTKTARSRRPRPGRCADQRWPAASESGQPKAGRCCNAAGTRSGPRRRCCSLTISSRYRSSRRRVPMILCAYPPGGPGVHSSWRPPTAGSARRIPPGRPAVRRVHPDQHVRQLVVLVDGPGSAAVLSGRPAGCGLAARRPARHRDSRWGAGRWRRRARRSRRRSGAARPRAGWSRAGPACGRRGWSS